MSPNILIGNRLNAIYSFISRSNNLKFQHILKFSTQGSNHYDIIITGGGMIGTTLACTLGKNTKLSNKQILLLESSKKNSTTLGENYANRVSTLNTNTYNLLNKIGAWKHIAAHRFSTVKRLQIWDALSDAVITFNNPDLSEPVAYVVENDLLLHAVSKELADLKNVTVMYETKAKEYLLPKLEEDITSVVLTNGQSYNCDLLLGCDGINSQVRNAMGISYISWNYDQRGIVATLKLSEPMENVVGWQRFLPNGVIALLPLNDSLSSLVWCTDVEQSKKLLELSDELFVDAVNDALWKIYERNSAVEEVTRSLNNFLEMFQLPTTTMRQLPPSVSGVESGSRAAFPLGFGHATNYVDKGVALVGDAAHRIHPLAGQGVNLGFGDVISLNDILGDAVYNGSTINSLSYLNQYETDRQRHNVPTMLAIDGLQKLYNTEFTPIVILRSLGLQVTHALMPLKKAIIGHAAQ